MKVYETKKGYPIFIQYSQRWNDWRYDSRATGEFCRFKTFEQAKKYMMSKHSDVTDVSNQYNVGG